MTIAVTPTQDDIYKALRAFLTAVLPDGTPINIGQDNRVPQPKSGDFVIMTAIMRTRIETNVDGYADASFHASIDGGKMTVDSIELGNILKGSNVFGIGVALNTVITDFSTGTGGVGTYQVNPTQQVDGPIQMASGAKTITQPVEVLIQCDVYGDNSAENSQIMTSSLRDEFSVDFFAAINPNIIPLHADDSKQAPFFDGEQQFETRYIVDVRLQVNTVLAIPQQFATALELDLVSVEAAPPAGFGPTL